MKNCLRMNKICENEDCRQWINFKKDLNCALIAIEENGAMTLKQVSDRLDISFVRVKQIQDKTIEKLAKRIKKDLKNEL